MTRRDNAETLSMAVHRQLHREILGGRLEPGERLRPTELKDRFDVSIGVIREALTQLAQQQLVESESNRGFRVVTLSMERLIQLTETRKINEGAALRLSLERGDVDWESEVIASHHRLSKARMYPIDDPEHSNKEFAVAHEAFHFALLGACENEYLLDVCHRLYDASELYRRWSTTSAAPDGLTPKKVVAAHTSIMAAALDRDVERAVELHDRHVERSVRVLRVPEPVE